MALPPPCSAMYLWVSTSSAKFASAPTACRAASTSPPVASSTITGMHTWEVSSLVSSSRLTLQRAAATSRWTSSSAELPADARDCRTPARTSRARLFGLVLKRRRAASARHWLCTLALFDRVMRGGMAPWEPMALRWSGLDAKLARQKVAYSRTSESGDWTSASSVGSALTCITVLWLDSFAMMFVSAISACLWESTSCEVARSKSGGRPPWTTTCTWVVGWFAMLQRQIAAYRRTSRSSFLVSTMAPCRPPPLVASPRVSWLAARLQSVITAYRAQSASGLSVSVTSAVSTPARTMAT
mmetsp:Transcript_41655/g.94002  ORF Transcript_41655/g.94002 Transcript_41655/m.94002 type:complete len:299 (-) Transcript_41655:7009-7905(-)